MPKKAFVFEKNEAGEDTDVITGIRFDFEDKTSETFTLDDVSEAMRVRAMWHGFSQKIGDSYASAGKAENALAFAKEAVRETIAQVKGENASWRAAAGEGGPRVTDLAVAMARVSGKTIEEVVAYLENQTDEQKKVWKKKPKIALELAKIAAEKQAAKLRKLEEQAAKAEEKAGEGEEEEEEIVLE